MNDKDFILKNYDSWLDNVLANFDAEFWASHLSGDDDDAGYLMDSLLSATRTWRERLTLEQSNDPALIERVTAHLAEQENQWWAQQNQDDSFISEHQADYDDLRHGKG